MMLFFHIEDDFDEILLCYIWAKYKIVGTGFVTTDIRRNSVPVPYRSVPVPYRSSEMYHFVSTNTIPPNFTNVLF